LDNTAALFGRTISRAMSAENGWPRCTLKPHTNKNNKKTRLRGMQQFWDTPCVTRVQTEALVAGTGDGESLPKPLSGRENMVSRIGFIRLQIATISYLHTKSRGSCLHPKSETMPNLKKQPPAPVPGISGQWCRRARFKAEIKSFGLFFCNTCKNEWQSAHAWNTSGQQCIKCRPNPQFVKPWAMWRNDDEEGGERQRNAGKPHIRRLCERCQLGLRCNKL
jgi:hypothetical protein